MSDPYGIVGTAMTVGPEHKYDAPKHGVVTLYDERTNTAWVAVTETKLYMVKNAVAEIVSIEIVKDRR